MSPATFARLKEAFNALRDLRVEERRAYLAALGERDPALLREIEGILAQHSESIDVSENLPEILATLAESASRSAPIPECVGPYRITGVLGEGGMGVVYRAEQTEPMRREVALKLMRRSVDSPRIARRFEAERQTLSLMEHPNIARMLDAGVHEDGSPYVVMELVRGVPVTEYCRENRISLRRRLELARTIARAVQHAHQKGIIHRDLKPSNLLVATQDGEPVPKVIDFGIAKALEPDPAMLTLTREGQLVGTLEYMSPEQALGLVGQIDTRGDVYSLGVILYELVTGELPYTVHGRSLSEAIRIITDEAPPSIRRGSTTRRLDPDIDTIIHKAMEKAPDRRYDNAAALADDLDRFLRSEPIVARPASRAYLFRKLVLRHRTASAAIGTTIVLLASFGVVAAVMLERQTQARHHAELESKKAQRTSAFLQEVLSASDASEAGSEVTVREMLDLARDKLESNVSEEPEVEVAVRMALARSYMPLQRPVDAEVQLRRALAACDRIAGDNRGVRCEVLIELALSINQQGRAEPADSVWLEAVEVDTATGDGILGRAQFLGHLARSSYARGQYARADSLFRRSFTMAKDGPGGRQPSEVGDLRIMALSAQRLGHVDEAEAQFRAGLDLTRRAPDKRQIAPHLAWYEIDLGTLLTQRGRYAPAESLLVSAIETVDHAFPASFDVGRAVARVRLGAARRCMGDYAGAESVLVRAASLVARFPKFRGDLALARHELGLVLAAEGRLEEAARAHARALALADSLGVDNLEAVTRRGLAELRVAEQRFDEADALFRDALGALDHETPPNELDIALTHLERGMAFLDGERADLAEPEIRLGMSALERTGWSSEWPAAVSTNELACCLALSRRDLVAAADLWRSSRETLLTAPSPVPCALRRRALAHTVRAMRSIDREPADYVAATLDGAERP